MSTKKIKILNGASIIPQSDWNQTDETKADYIKNKPVTYILNWSDGKDANNVQHPTVAEKQTIVDTIAEINTMEVGTYEVLLHVGSRYLPLITYQPPNLLVFREDWMSDEPTRYEIYAPSVESYSQEKSRYVEDSKYDSTIEGRRPATMQLTAQYINKQITNSVDNFCGYPLKGKTILVIGDSCFFGSGLPDVTSATHEQATNLVVKKSGPSSLTVFDLIAKKYGMSLYKDTIPSSTIAGNCTSIPDLNGGTIGVYSIAKRYSEIKDGQTVSVYNGTTWDTVACPNMFKAYGDASSTTSYKMFTRAGDYEAAGKEGYSAELIDTSDVVPDYIVINGGTNDLKHRASYNRYIDIGQNNDTDIKTFKGALNTIITGVKSKFPKAKLMFITPWKGSNSPEEDSGYCREDFVNAMLEICALKGVPCLDLFRNSGIDLTDDNQKAWADTGVVYGKNVGHLSEEAHQWIMPQIEAFLKGYTTSNVIPSLYIDSEATV